MNDTARNSLQATIKKIEGAYAPSTIRAYKSNFENFIKFCDGINQKAIPASSEVVVSFIKSISDGRLKSASIRIAVASIASIHKLNRLNDPVNDPDVKLEMRRMHRHLGRGSSQAYGINKDLLDKMIASTDSSLRGIRDKALLSLAYDTLCRRSEIVSLDIEDIIYTNNLIKICLRKSKTDPNGLGKILNLSEKTQEYLLQWLEKSKINTGRLFRGVKNNNQITASLNKAQINKIFKKLALVANVKKENITKISGHSTRVGAAQDLLKYGASIPMIMQKGRWSKIDTLMRYVENSGGV
ncbi:tyrosine-type recombinase/integrase [Candidatus Methylopumilus universalis]|uniref:tyrosine-type recombinase/integrase n=1 Tax=Candidatus Methylopumilus universalis TaxID=2588536 RepID=UPI001676274E|nr:tyrosine-type recombinase/integrase [Candidatus Methylopumilus universalis]